MCTRAISGGGDECAENGATIAPTQQRTERCEQTADDGARHGGRTTGERRLRDRDGFRRRAAAFCARIALSSPLHGDNGHANDANEGVLLRRWPPNLGALEVLMVSGRTARDDYWVLPGGGVENMESTEEAVIRELREEAGIRGKVLFRIGEFVDDQRFHHTTLFFLTVHEVFTEWGENCENGRQRRWMGMDEARQRIKQTQRDMLERSIKIIEQTLGDQLEPSVSKSLSAVPIVSLRAAEDAIHQQQQQQRPCRTTMAEPTLTTTSATAETECAIVIMVEQTAEDGLLAVPANNHLLLVEQEHDAIDTNSNKPNDDGPGEEGGRRELKQQRQQHHRRHHTPQRCVDECADEDGTPTATDGDCHPCGR